MAREPSPCGTVAAYRRHLRRGETPCAGCRAAKAAQARVDRAKRAKRAKRAGGAGGVVPKVVEITADGRGRLSRVEELEAQRDLLRARLHDPELDPRYVSALSKELRAVWAEIDELGKGEGESSGGDPLELIVGGASVVPFSSA